MAEEGKRPIRGKAIGALVVAVLLLFGWFVWPTPYSTELKMVGNRPMLLEINRFTRNSTLTPIAIKLPAKVSPETLKDLPASESEKLQCKATFYPDTCFVDLYNGSEWDVQEITLDITNGTGAIQRYQSSGYVVPMTKGLFEFKLQEGRYNGNYSIVVVRGNPHRAGK